MRTGKYSVIGAMQWLLFFLCVSGFTIYAQQENTADTGLLEELEGEYQLEIQGQKGIFVFEAEQGKLKGGFPAGEEPWELVPVKGEDLTFVGHSADGIEHLFKFLRNEDGKVTKCILSVPAMGLLVDMFKIEK